MRGIWGEGRVPRAMYLTLGERGDRGDRVASKGRDSGIVLVYSGQRQRTDQRVQHRHRRPDAGGRMFWVRRDLEEGEQLYDNGQGLVCSRVDS